MKNPCGAQRARPTSPVRAVPAPRMAVPVAAVLAGLLAGCAAPLRPDAPRLDAGVAAWQAPRPVAAPGLDAARPFERFGDPVLPLLVQAAQDASGDLAAARARYERARAVRVAAGAQRLPQADFAVSATRGTNTPALPPSTSAGASAQVAWELDWLGAAAAGTAAAQARLDASAAQWHAARVALAAETAGAYVSLRACEAQLTQAEADAASRAETARLTGLSARAGFTAPADAALADASAAQGRAQATALRTQCEQIVKALVEVTGWPEPLLRERLGAGRGAVPSPAPIAPAQVPADVLQQRPDLYAAAREVEAAAGDTVQAEAQRQPRVSITGSLGALTVRSGGSDLNGAVWSLGPLAVSVPLFDGGRRTADAAAARAAYDAAVAAWHGRARQAVREVEQALLAFDGAAASQADALQAAQGFEASFRATEARQRGGLASLLELEQARRTAVAARSALVDLERERAQAWIDLYRALGGGWTEGLRVPEPASRAGAPTAAAAGG